MLDRLKDAADPSPNAGGRGGVSPETAALLRVLLHVACDLSLRDIGLVAGDIARGAAPDRAYWAGLKAGGEAARRATALSALAQALADWPADDIARLAKCVRGGSIPPPSQTVKPERGKRTE
jgi:hypothetical protein